MSLYLHSSMCHLYLVLLLVLLLFNFFIYFFYFYFSTDRYASLGCVNQATYNSNMCILTIIFLILLGSVCMECDDWG